MQTFEKEIITCIKQYNSDIKIADNELIGKTVHICDKNIVYHLMSINNEHLENISPTYFQEKSLIYDSQGLQLVHLWEDYWNSKREIIHSRISALSGSCTRIQARKTTSRRIEKKLMSGFLSINHLQSFVAGRYNYGLYRDEQLLAVASFSSGRTFVGNGFSRRSFELLRFANLLHHRVTGGLGKIIARFIKDVKPDDIMTYADLDWASGKSYKALGFEQTEITAPQFFWIHPTEMIRHYPHRLPENITIDFYKQKTYDNIGDFLIDKGYIKISNAGNIKFLKFLVVS